MIVAVVIAIKAIANLPEKYFDGFESRWGPGIFFGQICTEPLEVFATIAIITATIISSFETSFNNSFSNVHSFLFA